MKESGRRRVRRFAPAARLACEAGQSTVEFALVLPILVMVLGAIVEFGIGFHDYMALTDTVRVAARAAALNGSSLDSAQQAAQDAASQAGGGLTVPVTVQFVDGGTDVEVTGTTPYSIGIFGFSLQSGELSSTTTERIEA
ncbi:MAG: pilus assembly protein [Actinobacteria bacterium]|nr:pilus assembly protein [Actinomycetota bacterium]MBV8396449.1 pilus assembly protein [Actinomycetota bacterium]MBV8599163.1 pilus assembly protein [Actinomycetota bacterium]